MPHLRQAVLATLAYYDALGMPLTAEEVHNFLINPSRIENIPSGLGEFKINDIEEVLNRLVSSSQIFELNGFFMFPDRGQFYETRFERNKIARYKWRKFIRIMKWLTIVPYLRGVFASGSLAMGNTDKDSDFDVLIIAREGRLYTSRLFLWFLTSILGVRRKPYEISAPDRICFNHYITDDNLYIPHESLFNAQMYVNLRPVVMTEELFSKFYSHNPWLNTYVYNFRPNHDLLKYCLKIRPLPKLITRISEAILNSKFGDWLEDRVGKLQKDKIEKNPITHEPGGRVVFTNSELEFHPRSFEKVVLARYKSRLAQLGIKPLIDEKDSGLKT